MFAKTHSILTAMLVGLGLSAVPAQASIFQICVRVNIQTTDSNVSVNGFQEDYYLGTNTAGGVEVIGRGFRVDVSQGGQSATFNTRTSDGCFTFTHSTNTGFAIRVYGYATDGEGNRIRIHDGGLDTSSWYPGATYSAFWDDQTLEAVNYYVVDGAVSDRWTTMAVAAFGLYRWDNSVNGSTVSIGFSEANCGDSGSTHGDAENYVESHNAHLMRVGRCGTSSTETRQKMLVTHELGHAMARLYYGYDGNDSPLNDNYAPPVGTPSGCVNVASYDLRSLEWNSLAFKEGFADFYSARVWNNPDAHGSYARFGTLIDLEAWDASGGTNTPGGYASNVCGSNADGVSTRQDYLRFFWDWHTAPCSSQPSQHDLLALYRAVRENDRTGDFDLNDSNYDDAILFAVDDWPSLSNCEVDQVSVYLTHNHAG